ncbi:hypothetical protein [Kitasatospora sp. LaBMicrA B282]|uniref:hypothetical protein n=1 Tax=Kitasatospora sp. LaBMicrA B282 TaxID=3420949 RepID=UPI003D0E6AD2
MSGESVLDPVQALALAERAQQAGRRPRVVPGWYGPVFGSVLVLYGTVVGAARAYRMNWLMLVGVVVLAAVMGLVARLGARSSGVVLKPTAGAGWRGFVFGGTAGVLAVAAAAGLACWPLGGELAAGAGAGTGAGVGFWVLMLLANRKVRREQVAG